MNQRAELRPLPRPPRVLLVALGDTQPRSVQAAAEALRETLALPVKVAPSLDTPGYAFNKERGQYHATSILRRLATLRTGAAPIVGILEVDLFLPDAPYVLGDADRDAGAALFSLSRLGHPDPERVRRRTKVEAVHAAGHLLGLSHCPDFRCAMFLSRDAADADRKGPGLCASCRSALGLAGG